jgi:hypothetical protein
MAVNAKGNVTLEVNVGTTASPDWDVVPGFATLDGGGTAQERVDTTNFNTAGNRRTYNVTFVNDQPITVMMRYAPGDATQEFIRDAASDGDEVQFRFIYGVDYGDQSTYTVTAHVENFGLPVGPIDGLLENSFQISPTGAGVWS